MKITDIVIRKLRVSEKVKAIVSITIDDMLAIHEIKVIQGTNRLFVAMPSRKDTAGFFRDIVHPISESARTMIETVVLEAYEKQIALAELGEE